MQLRPRSNATKEWLTFGFPMETCWTDEESLFSAESKIHLSRTSTKCQSQNNQFITHLKS